MTTVGWIALAGAGAVGAYFVFSRAPVGPSSVYPYADAFVGENGPSATTPNVQVTDHRTGVPVSGYEYGTQPRPGIGTTVIPSVNSAPSGMPTSIVRGSKVTDHRA